MSHFCRRVPIAKNCSLMKEFFVFVLAGSIAVFMIRQIQVGRKSKELDAGSTDGDCHADETARPLVTRETHPVVTFNNRLGQQLPPLDQFLCSLELLENRMNRAGIDDFLVRLFQRISLHPQSDRDKGTCVWRSPSTKAVLLKVHLSFFSELLSLSQQSRALHSQYCAQVLQRIRHDWYCKEECKAALRRALTDVYNQLHEISIGTGAFLTHFASIMAGLQDDSLPCSRDYARALSDRLVFFGHLLSVGHADGALFEYLDFILDGIEIHSPKWVSSKTQFYTDFRPILRKIINYPNEARLFRALDHFSDILTPAQYLKILVSHKMVGEVMTADLRSPWESITVRLVSRCESCVFERSLRYTEFKGTDTYAESLLVHFAPIIRLFQLRNEGEFAAEWGHLVAFLKYCSGDRDQELPPGRGGMQAIDRIVRLMQSTLLAFSDEPTIQFRAEVFKFLLERLFPSMAPVKLLSIFGELKLDALFEGMLCFCPFSFAEEDLLGVVTVVTLGTNGKESYEMLLMLVAYSNFGLEAWGRIAGGMSYSNWSTVLESIVLMAKYAGNSLDSDLIQADQPGVWYLPPFVDSDVLDDLGSLLGRTFQYDVMRVVLTRKFGIPVHQSRREENLASFESATMPDIVEYGNFVIRHVAVVNGITSELVRIEIKTIDSAIESK